MNRMWEKQKWACKLHRLAENGNMKYMNRVFFAELREHFLSEIKREAKEIEDARNT